MSDQREPIERPNASVVLEGLKDFQRRTVDHVDSRFFDEEDPCRRFLVADEVGLGKTLVARGVTAKLVDRLWDEVERIDVIYICSNTAIATQNIRKLQITRDAKFAHATRLTLLPRVSHDLQSRKLNFVSLTPGTSFSRHSATGTGEERALLYLMLRDAWGLGDRKGPLNVFCHQKDRNNFEWDIYGIENTSTIDSQLKRDFLANVEGSGLREHFEETQEYFLRRQWKAAPEEGRAKQHRLIDELRRTLARSCVDALEPDLVILDEFQRFQHLLELDNEGNPTSDAGELAHQLFSYEDPATAEHARTLLLSATPYTAFGIDPDDPETSHHQAFIETVSFLLDDRLKVDELQGLFSIQRDVMLGQLQGTETKSSANDGIRELLLRSMCRTERLGATSDRDGMLKQVNHGGQTLKTDDVLGYLAAQEVGSFLKVPDLIEFWKSSPYLLNMMDGYRFNKLLSDDIEFGLPEDISRHLKDGAPGVLDRNTIENLEAIDPGNARLRELWREIKDAGAPRLLWLNPSLTYYEPSGPFAEGGADRFTKRLVFSNWMLVPKAISSILSYSVEQDLFESGGGGPTSYSEQSKTAGSLKALFVADRVAPSFALLYPSRELAELFDPIQFAAGSDSPDSNEICDRIAEKLRLQLAGLQKVKVEDGNEDKAWYWAAPLLLDAKKDPDGTKEFLNEMRWWDPADPTDVEGEVATRTQWEQCLDLAEDLLNGEFELGRQPADLPDVIARLALGGFGTTAYRALARQETGLELDDMRVRAGGLRVGQALRALFNLPHSTHLLQSLQKERAGRTDALWRECLEYAIFGNLQATLDEFAHLLPDHRGIISDGDQGEVAHAIAEAMTDAIGLRTTRTAAGFFDVDSDGAVSEESKWMRARFAVPFVNGQSDEKHEVDRVEQVRAAFNSPFWPFVLTSTSVGQEGLDFHLYCHAVVHWNLPSNPVDLEQREGRVHRYKNHAVRRNLAAAFKDEVLDGQRSRKSGSNPWTRLFEAGVDHRPDGQSELWPFWIFTPDESDDSIGPHPFAIERHIMAMPLSRDEAKLKSLLKSLVLYRSVLGQPRQEDLVKVLEESNIEDLEAFSERTRIDLSPPCSEA